MSRQPKATRKPGGQPGNQNRLVHGIYAKQLSSEDSELLESMPADLTEHELPSLVFASKLALINN